MYYYRLQYSLESLFKNYLQDGIRSLSYTVMVFFKAPMLSIQKELVAVVIGYPMKYLYEPLTSSF